MNNTGLKDKNGKLIKIGDKVTLEGNEYDVTVNEFDKRIVVDNEMGQSYLIDVHMICEIVTVNLS